MTSKAPVKYRTYVNYAEYVEHQKRKLERHLKGLRGSSDRRHLAMAERIKILTDSVGVKNKGKVLCLGARLGEEVCVFISLGFDAIGIDLNPGPNNQYVVEGDFHDLKYSDSSFDILYTNCLDHTFDIDKVVAEALRVLVPGGLFLLEISNKKQHSLNRKGKVHLENDNYESMLWTCPEDLVRYMKCFQIVTETTSVKKVCKDSFKSYVLRSNKV